MHDKEIQYFTEGLNLAKDEFYLDSINKFKMLIDEYPNSVINTWTQSLVITLNLCHEFTPKKMESKREGRDSSLC